MSPSSNRRPRVRAVTAAAIAVVIGVTGPVWPADAAPAGAPVVDIIAPVVDIATTTQDLAGAASVEDRPTTTKVRLDSTLLFGRDSAKLRPGARARISEVADHIKTKGPGRITITGYTDDLGSRQHGLTLSRRRAAAVADVLRDRLPADRYRYTLTGRGESDPAVPNTNEANRRQNRRVILTYRNIR